MSSQSQNNELTSFELILFEVLERIAVFYLHLRETDIRFFPPRSPNLPESHFVDSYFECLSKLLYCTSLLELKKSETHPGASLGNSIQKLCDIINAVKVLHKSELNHLPRPPQPPELKRFGRILQTHALSLKETSQNQNNAPSEISVYLGEDLSETAFAGDPLVEYKQSIINEIIGKLNAGILDHENHRIDKFPEPEQGEIGYHLTIPRIDASNPCRWPTLVHELGHRIMDRSFFKHGDIEEDFLEVASRNRVQFGPRSGPKFDLKHWLTECWCDLFAAVVIGPSFWFAQWSSFLFNLNNESYEGCKTHPPALFRLHLIKKVLNHRFSDALTPQFKRSVFEAKNLIAKLDAEHEEGFVNNHRLREIVLQFQDYFINHFFIKYDDGTLVLGENSLNDKLGSLIKYTEKIDKCVIDFMVESLSDGLPIPSVQTSVEETWRERPSTVQEILLSAWIYRNAKFRRTVLAQYYDIVSQNRNDENAIWLSFVDNIVKVFSAFSFSVLRSIQVSEWFDLYEKEDQTLSETVISKANNRDEVKEGESVLVDYQIFNLIKSKQLRIIPVISFGRQIGSTSLDIRLGTSFQVYSPNQIGIVDLTSSESVQSANINSNLVDLDFLKAITIAPGQFMLGHSMEYICLPESISAQVDGRSSFARLGIEVHMTAGFVDPGFQGVLTFELFNAGPNPVRLYPGIRIGQLRFFRGSPPGKPYNRNPTAKYRGLLQHRNSLQFEDYEVKILKDALMRADS